jgi:hypothetical protein
MNRVAPAIDIPQPVGLGTDSSDVHRPALDEIADAGRVQHDAGTSTFEGNAGTFVNLDVASRVAES